VTPAALDSLSQNHPSKNLLNRDVLAAIGASEGGRRDEGPGNSSSWKIVVIVVSFVRVSSCMSMDSSYHHRQFSGVEGMIVLVSRSVSEGMVCGSTLTSHRLIASPSP
jgi:hypothetical protein